MDCLFFDDSSSRVTFVGEILHVAFQVSPGFGFGIPSHTFPVVRGANADVHRASLVGVFLGVVHGQVDAR
jgi:hypothetical protein